MCKKVAIYLLIAVLLVPAVNAEWDYSWAYRVPVEIQSSTPLRDYQVKLVVDTQSLISAGKMKSNCEDVRFTDSNSNLLNYWIESGVNTAETVIWVKVPEITSSTTIYMYYGNPDAESASNGEKTFLFFDDFNSLSGWKLEQSCTITGNCEIATYEEKSCLRMRGGTSEIVHSLAGMPATGYGVKILSRVVIPDNQYNYWGEFMPFFGFGQQ